MVGERRRGRCEKLKSELCFSRRGVARNGAGGGRRFQVLLGIISASSMSRPLLISIVASSLFFILSVHF